MNILKKNQKPLPANRETLPTLQGGEIATVVGGSRPTTPPSTTPPPSGR
jgi:hypothetical protein